MNTEDKMTISQYANNVKMFINFLKNSSILNKERNAIVWAVLEIRAERLIDLIKFNQTLSGKDACYFRYHDIQKFVHDVAKTNPVTATSDPCVNMFIDQEVANKMMEYVLKNKTAVDVMMINKIPIDLLTEDFVRTVRLSKPKAFDGIKGFWDSELGHLIDPNHVTKNPNVIQRSLKRVASIRRSVSTNNLKTQAELQVTTTATTSDASTADTSLTAKSKNSTIAHSRK